MYVDIKVKDKGLYIKIHHNNNLIYLFLLVS